MPGRLLLLVSWNTNNSGLPGTGAITFGDDLFSNVYAIAGGEVFRSDSGTAPWTRIDTSISHLILDPISSYASPYNYISGDSLLYLGTQVRPLYQYERRKKLAGD